MTHRIGQSGLSGSREHGRALPMAVGISLGLPEFGDRMKVPAFYWFLAQNYPPWTLGLAALCFGVPVFALSRFGGKFADRAGVMRAAVVAALALALGNGVAAGAKSKGCEATTIRPSQPTASAVACDTVHPWVAHHAARTSPGPRTRTGVTRS